SSTQKPKRNEQAEKQIDAWYERYIAGEVKLDDDRMPPWVRTGIEERLEEPSGETEVKPGLNDQDIDFKILVKSIPQLPKATQKKVAEKASRYIKMGMSPYNALNEAISDLNVIKEAEERGKKVVRMGIPAGGNSRQDTSGEISDSARRLGKKMGIKDSSYDKYAKSKK